MKRVMNVRVVEEDGKYTVQFVYQIYKVGAGLCEWQSAAPSTVERLKRKLEAQGRKR